VTPEPRTLFLVITKDRGTWVERREYLVLGWATDAGQIVPVVADENSARPHVLTTAELDDAFYVIPPLAVYSPDKVDEPLWIRDFVGIERSHPSPPTPTTPDRKAHQ
jgi:hypothetical protein